MHIAFLLVAFGCSLVLGLPLEQGTFSGDMENPRLFDGDIMPAPESKNGVVSPKLRWPNGILSYVISSEFTPDELAVIQGAIDWYNNNTCIKMVKQTNETAYVNIIRTTSGCSSSVVGRTAGYSEYYSVQDLALDVVTKPCFSRVAVLHELLHAIGFNHMQSDPDRDNYVTLIYENIPDDWRYMLKPQTSQEATSFGLEYDYHSILHYGQYAYSKKTNPMKISMMTKDKTMQDVIGTATDLSPTDVKKISLMYNCE